MTPTRTARGQSQRPPLAPDPADPDVWRHRAAGLLVLTIALLFVAGLAWVVLPHGGDRGGVLADRATPAPSPTLSVAVPSAAPSPSPSLVAAATATPEPTATIAPSLAPTPARSPRPAAQPAPRPTPAVNLPARDPAGTVARFYDLVEAHRFEAAAALWSARMRAQYPPSGYIDGRFAHTTRIVLHRDRIVALNARAGTAVVAVDLTEYRDNSPARRFVGRWDLVLGRSGWLLDRPHF